MDTVYDLWFVREYEHREDTELHIGIYASEADAVAVVEALKISRAIATFLKGSTLFPQSWA